MSEHVADPVTVRELQAHLEALATRLDEQAGTIREQQAKLARLEGEATASTPPVAALTTSERKVDRRGMLTTVVGATAAAALLTVAKEATTAEASSRTTVLNGSASTGNYGIAAAVDVLDPGTLIPNLGGNGFGVVGTFGSPGYAPPFSAGVLGQGSGAFYGVIGLSQNNPGVYGRSTSGTGVSGTSNTGVGTIGSSGGNIGVYGASSANVGVFGDAANNTAVMGRTTVGIGVYGTASNPGGGGRAAVFDGTVLVNGPFTVVGGPKSAGVKLPDGSVGRVYCQESPEPYFEDFGTGQLIRGKAEIRLEAGFAAITKADDYLVFPVPEGDCKGLYVSQKGPTRFVVEELQGGTSTLPFSYRVVARRRDEVGKRLETVDVRPAQSKDVKPPDLSVLGPPARPER